MGFMLKGIPKTMSEHIELPNMAELLTYPVFYDCPIEEAYKYGTDFQRKVLDMVPLRGGKRYTTVLSEVRFIPGSFRSCTGFSQLSHDNADREWHIDTVEEEDGSMVNYWDETDHIHLLTSENSGMTEFIDKDVWLPEINPQETPLHELLRYVAENRERLGYKPVKMPSNRIVSFSNHMHRATDSSQIEFRYMLRVVETDRKRPPSNPEYNRDYTTTIIGPDGEKIENISQQSDRIVIYLPETISQDPGYRPTEPTLDVEVKVLDIGDAAFSTRNTDGVKLAVLAETGGRDVAKFMKAVDDVLILSEGDNTDNYFTLRLKEVEEKFGNVVATYQIDPENAQYLRETTYLITFRNEKAVRFGNANSVKVRYSRNGLENA
jgi:hypothetical protein